MNVKAIWDLLKTTFDDWNEDRAPRLAAALSYYTVFSIAPLLVVIIAIAGLVFGRQAAQGHIVGQIEGLVGKDAAQAIQGMVQAASNHGASIFATIVGIISLLLGAGGVFGQLQDALNTIWGVQPKPGLSLIEQIKQRVMPYTMLLGVGFLLVVSLVLSATIAAVSTFVGGLLPALKILAGILDIVLSLIVITLLFAMMYKFLPDAKIAWRDVWIGAFGTAVLFTIGKFLIGLYLGHSSVTSTYGAAGSLVIILIWVYYSGLILFFGAEFTKVYAQKYGSRIQPAPTAVAITPEARAEQGMPTKEQVESAAKKQGKEGAPAQPEPQGAMAQTQQPEAGVQPIPSPEPLRTPVAATAGEGVPPPGGRNWLGLVVTLFGFLIGLVIGRNESRGIGAG